MILLQGGFFCFRPANFFQRPIAASACLLPVCVRRERLSSPLRGSSLSRTWPLFRSLAVVGLPYYIISCIGICCRTWPFLCCRTPSCFVCCQQTIVCREQTMVWWQHTMVWSGQTIVERRIRCRWLVAKRSKRGMKRRKVARSSSHERQGERSSFCSKKKIEKKDAGVVYCLQNNKKAARAAEAGVSDCRLYAMHKANFLPL